MAEDVFGIVGTTQAGNFHVEQVVAEGGFGVVYRALHGGFRAPVALKCLKIPGTMTLVQREGFLEKFREEGELLFRLSASIPEVVRPLHVDVLNLPDGRFVPFIALEWLEGLPLDRILEQRREEGKAPMSLPKLVKLIRPIAQALARAHHFHGPNGVIAIVHRDLKPENIFVSQIAGSEVVKVLDFGIAKAKSVATQRAGRLTAEDGMNAFTPAYGAPEQWLPKRFGQTGPWTDVWGLAITMVEALAGHPPIDGEMVAMMGTAIDEKRRPTPRNEGVVIAPEVDEVFARALAVDPRHRTSSVEIFWTELEKAMGIPTSFAQRDDRREPGTAAEEIANAPRSKAFAWARKRDEAATLAAPPDLSAAPAPPVLELSLPIPAELRPAAAAVPVVAAEMSLELELPAPRSIPAAPSSKPAAMSDALQAFDDLDQSKGMPLDVAPAPRRAPSARSLPPTSGPVSSIRPLSPIARPPLSNPPHRRPLAPPIASRLGAPPSELRDLGTLLARPIRLIAIAIGITAIDLLVTRLSGETLMIGPVRPAWVAGPLALVGVGLAFWRIFGARGDE